MARLLDDAASQYLESGQPPVTGPPFTLACWFNSDSIALSQALMAIGQAASPAERYVLLAAGAAAGDPLQVQLQSGGTASTTTGYQANTWHHACGVFASSTDRRVYLDGGSKGSNTAAASASPPNTVTLGTRYAVAGRGQYLSGLIARAAIWSVALTDDEVALLATGVDPRTVRPDALLRYWPLRYPGAVEYDEVGTGDLTVSGGTQAEDPPLRGWQLSWQPLLAAAAGVLQALGGICAGRARNRGALAASRPVQGRAAAEASGRAAATAQRTVSGRAEPSGSGRGSVSRAAGLSGLARAATRARGVLARLAGLSGRSETSVSARGAAAAARGLFGRSEASSSGRGAPAAARGLAGRSEDSTTSRGALGAFCGISGRAAARSAARAALDALRGLRHFGGVVDILVRWGGSLAKRAGFGGSVAAAVEYTGEVAQVATYGGEVAPQESYGGEVTIG